MAGGQASGSDTISSSVGLQNGLLNNLKLIARFVDLSGSKTISVKTIRSSPGDNSRIFQDEGNQYAPGIKVIYNDHAYNNEDLMESWLKDDIPTVKSATEDFLLVMDAATFHLTDRVKEEVRRQLVTPALIPAGWYLNNSIVRKWIYTS
ncbi:hypothetical protein FOXB_17678 [Fusarium oxysporum f. sp. conglutinans Fo5176]|uniref:DDE-1 domain-containing protein n=1 Tax=Fusarium oxysporum (strain Fo5176) TaxID=660025 RepID=F9GG94_FUSOF|nr:hypothetical protein FOXB_17678 [Fusarium oxysporum f. sp. conglutinans Fo5176]